MSDESELFSRDGERERAKSGIPVLLPVVEELRDVRRRTGIPLSA